MTRKSVRGSVSHHAGQAAEIGVARDYESRGFTISHRRWRGSGGEIDLIARNDQWLVFVEVKKSSSFENAATRISRRQINRICASAAQFLAQEPNGQMTNVRFDAALVNASGAIQIIENAFGQT
ncbi:MAG: YraN family protein [Ruegeria sp.]